MNKSSWISNIQYINGFLIVHKLDGKSIIYGDVPSWIPGLLQAHKSLGAAYNKLVRGKYPSQTESTNRLEEVLNLKKELVS